MNSFLDEINRNKIKIIRTWINIPNVSNLIKSYKLDENLFIKRYSFALIEYYLMVAKDDENITNDYAIIDFIKYLKKHNIKIAEFYLLFASFKDALVEFLYSLDLKSKFISDRIEFYFKKIFTELLEFYSKSISEVESALNKSIDIVDSYVLISRCDVDGKITSVSNAFCKTFNYEAFELIGKNIGLINHPDMEQNIIDDIENSIKSGNMWNGEFKAITKDKKAIWLKTTIHPNFDNSGKIIGYDAINIDISSNKELENKQQILVEQSKSAAMGEMISMIAHQWRQPLQAISILNQKLYMIKMLNGQISDKDLEDVSLSINEQLDYMSKTVDDFRDYFKPNKRKEEVYIEQVINKSIEFLAYLLKLSSIKLEYKNSSKSKISLYLNDIMQVFINLIKNSNDTMLERNIEKKEIYINSYEKDDFIYIEFEDSAKGIKEEYLSKIFDPYFSTKSTKNGTGLGLYMCKAIIEQHSNGKIKVENSKIGAKFTIELPIN